MITAGGVGAIKISYNKNGDIDKVESADGPTVALSVASIFNSLLNAIELFTSAVKPETEFDLLTAEPHGCTSCGRSVQF
jgi:hypothetical protein